MALVSLQSISIAFGGRPLLDGATLQIESGERVGLVGRNGEGKSTLLKLVANVLEPDHYPVPWSVSRSSDPKSLSQKSILAAAGCADGATPEIGSEGIRVHCASHNSLTAREYFGKAYMEAKIAEARARRRAASLTSR